MFKKYNYEEKLQTTPILTFLKVRRELGDLIETYKIHLRMSTGSLKFTDATK